jgi:hypothetical protein
MKSRWRYLLCAAGALLFGFLSAGCSQAVPEYNIYVQAFNAQYEQGDAVLDIVGQAERVVVLRRLERRSDSFDPDNAAYYLDNVDPPITASVRASLRVLKAYNDALAGLANGEAAEVLVTRMSGLATNVSAAGSAASVALGGPAAAAGAEVLIAGTAKALEIAMPILRTAATAASREAFRQQLIEAYPAMRDLIIALRKGTPDMFEMIRRSLVTRGSDESRTGRSAEGDRILNKDRQLLAGWVILMDKTLVALDQAVAAAKSGNSATRIAGLTDASIELKVFAEQMKLIRLKQ